MSTVFGIADVDRIVTFAKRFPIFPCRARTETVTESGRTWTYHPKSPLTHNGFHAATQDANEIRSWWRQWPEALVGVPTGQATGLVVLDYDPDNATQATHEWMAEHTNLLCSSRAHKTARNGFHYLFTSADRYQTGTDLVLGGSPRKGIDLRANGGYVIWWPLHGGEVTGETFAPVPAGLIDERRFDPSRDLTPLPTIHPRKWRAERDRAREALIHLEPDGYEFWIRVGMALHHASGGSDEGFSLWHDWSAKGNTYDGMEDCRYHWASFGDYPGRALGLGTLYAAAKEAGYQPPAAAPRPEVPPLEAYAQEPELAAKPVKAVKKNDTPASPIKVTWAREYDSLLSAPRFLVGNLIESGSLVLVYGESNTGKSTFAIDVALTCGRGMPWRGRRTRKAISAYLPLEGARGVRQRVQAKLRYDDVPEEVPFADLTGRLDLLNPTGTVVLLGTLRQVHGIDSSAELILIVDTVSRAMAGGDENSSQDMGALIGACDLIRSELGCTVMLIHHAGKDATKGARGHSSLRAAVDTEIEVTGTVNPRVVTVRKQRDLPSGETFAFDLETVALGTDPETYDPISACVAVYRSDVPGTQKQAGGKNQRELLAAIRGWQTKGAAIITRHDLHEIAKGLGGAFKKWDRRDAAIAGLEERQLLTPTIGGFHVSA